MSMCLVLLCCTGFLEMLIALILSQNKVITSCLTSYSSSICFIHINCVLLLPAAMYSASAVERDTQFCFLLNQEIRLLPIKKHPPDVLFLSSEHPAQSASQYPINVDDVLCVFKIPYSLVPFTYLIILLTCMRWLAFG